MASAKENVVTMPTKASNIFEEAVAMVVDLGKLGRTRKLKGGAYEVEGTDKERTQASKKLLQCDEFEDIVRFDNRTRFKMATLSVSASEFREGVWMVKLCNYNKVVAMLKERRAERLELVDALMKKYKQAQADDEEALGPNFNPADYPSEDEARARFRMDWYSIQFSTPSSVKSISRQAWEEESNSMKEMVRDMTTDFQKTLCVEMQAVVDHMLECVQGNLNGKKRKFNSDLVDKAVEFFDNLPGRNITNVAELDKLAKQAKSILEGVESQDIRDRSSVRKEVASGFAEIKATLETLVVDKPKRAVAIRKKEV